MNHGFSQMSTPPPSYGAPRPGYVPPPGYGYPPPKKNNTATVVIIVLVSIFGGGIFVVAILAAILFPVFQKVRGNARLTSCESNVRQIELGLTMYTQNNNGTFPAGDYKAALTQYTGNGALFHCPADTVTGGASDYSLNQSLQGVSLAKLSDPSHTVAIYEGSNRTLDFRHEHTGGAVAVVGFADGHVKAVSAQQAKLLRWRP